MSKPIDNTLLAALAFRSVVLRRPAVTGLIQRGTPCSSRQLCPCSLFWAISAGGGSIREVAPRQCFVVQWWSPSQPAKAPYYPATSSPFWVTEHTIRNKRLWYVGNRRLVQTFLEISMENRTTGSDTSYIKETGAQRNIFFSARVVNPWNELVKPTVAVDTMDKFNESWVNLDTI